MKLSPNPFIDIIIAELGEVESFPVDMIITSLAGEHIHHDRIFTSKKIVDLSNLSPNLYRIELKSDDQVLHEGFYRKIEE
ncbi:MAG: hypothetical protein R2809_02830 [Flavobacteriales bacterium]